MLKPHNHPVESHGRTALRNYIIQASTLLEIILSGLVLIGLLFSIVPLLKWMPGLLFDGNDAEIRTFLERALDIVIGIEFIKMLAKHSPGSSLEVLLYAIARHMVVGHESAVENLLSVGAIALIAIVATLVINVQPQGASGPVTDIVTEGTFTTTVEAKGQLKPISSSVVSPSVDGTVDSINVQAGQSVNEGDVLIVLEAMKMENEIVATKSGTVAQIVTAKGAVVETGAPLVVIA